MELLNQLTFIERGVVAGVIIGVIAPIVGAFLLVRRVSIISESISHITLAGISAGVFIGTIGPVFESINPMYFGVLFALLGALVTEQLRNVYRHFQELAIPIILSTAVGMSAIFISLARTGYNEWYSYLFGSIVSVTVSDLQFIMMTALLVILLIGLFYKEFISISFDQEFAKVSGISIKIVNFVFALLIALVISMSMKIVGILLVGALVVIPVATSIQLARSFKQLVGYGIVFSQVAIASGLYFSYQYAIATGGMIVLMSVLLLMVILAFKKVRG
ncbi:metal ABC transporter permease [Halalkalibacter krulwichiae]|uniref:High-affinity zinc uptake system membrane protein ZnuB n=1 Tax=Halalkalibacter krulwichiae TaxID=199441 RepID=A0A1X9M7F5_9BACI|nr:metal ABC transporter permease [Halalkalibacter krulwichiae]ARK29359.1 High-affinity zinc uptake system membrane protein ZnuB [Halalkalibacter krulwichiae]